MNTFASPKALAAVAGCLIIAYPACAWYTGTRIEARMNEVSTQLTQMPNIQVVKHEFKRGLFTSTEETVIQLPAELFAKPAEEGGVSASPAPQIHLINHITHGPFPGLRFGSATVDTEIVLDGEMKADVEKVFGKQAPLQILTKLNYFGGGSVAISSPAVSTTIEKSGDKIDWKGFKVDIGFDADYKKLSYQLNAPGLTAHSADGSDMTMGSIVANGDMQQAIPNTLFYLGKSTATLEQLKLTNANSPTKTFDLQKVTLESDATSKADFVDLVAKIDAQKLTTSSTTFNDIHYDYSLKHLQQASLAKLFDAMYRPKLNQSKDDPSQAMLGPWKEFGPVLLQNKPEFSIDRISLSTPEGEAKLTGKASLGAVTPEEIENPKLMLAKLMATASISIPEPLISKMMLGGASDADTKAAMEQGLKQQITVMEQQGYIVRKEKMLTAELNWNQGIATINGKPMPGFSQQ